MLSSGNQTKSETSGKIRLFQKLPLRLHLNSEQMSSYDIKALLMPNSTNTPTILSSRSSPRKNTERFKILISKISDFADNQQINKAVSSAETTKDRLKIIDFIIKRRREIDNLAIQNKLEKAAPLIKNLQQSFKMKLNNHISGRHVNKFKTIIHHLKTEGDDSSPRLPPTRSTTQSSRFTFAPNKILEALPHLKQNRHRPSIEIITPLSNRHARNENTLSPDADARALSSFSPTPRDDNHLGTPMLGPDSRRSSGLPVTQTHVLEKFGKTEYAKEKIDTARSWLVKEKQIKHVTKYIKHSAHKSIRDEAEKTLEKDLCRYLMKNADCEEDVFLPLKSGKEPQIRKVERRALTYYETLQNRRVTEGDTTHDIRKALQGIQQTERKSIFVKKK